MSLLIISDHESDLAAILKAAGGTVMTAREATDADISGYDSVALLFGEENTTSPDPYLRDKLEKLRESGAKMFIQFSPSFAYVYCDSPKRLSHDRLVSVTGRIPGIETGDILDAHYNLYMRPWCMMPDSEVLLYVHDYITAHAHTDMPEDKLRNGNPALWTFGSVMMCQIIVDNFNKARLSPRASWEALIRYICSWLGVDAVNMPSPVVTHTEKITDFDSQLDACISSGLGWLRRNLRDGGSHGICEGVSHNITPDGRLSHPASNRADCAGEAAGSFIFAGDEDTYDRLESFIYGPMQIKDGEYKGMIRWSDCAWGVCYGDDNARAIIPTLLAAVLLKNDKYLSNALADLDFLADSTAKDGLRPSRTDNINYLTSGSVRDIADKDSGYPSAHYNAYYSAALLLGYIASGNERYLDIGRRGLETLMSLYPETKREQSETEEICRLIFPLAVLYECTKEPKHLDMLDRVTADLESHRHPFGGFAEWDTGYKANCARTSGGECSLLADNGDPVADLLYASNWLPLGFAWAYRATGDERYLRLWQEIASFMIRTQIHSADSELDGGWARAFDMDRREIHGLPHDAGWAACCIESGWTVAEIVTGLEVMKYIK